MNVARTSLESTVGASLDDWANSEPIEAVSIELAGIGFIAAWRSIFLIVRYPVIALTGLSGFNARSIDLPATV